MSVENNKALVRAAYEAVSAGELDGFMDRLADDVKWTFFGKHRFAGTMVGKEEILNTLFTPLSGQLVDGLTLNLNTVIAEGDKVVIEATGQSDVVGGGTYNNTYCYVVTVRDNKITEMREYLDTELVSDVFGHKE